jgi:hypothetical protein
MAVSEKKTAIAMTHISQEDKIIMQIELLTFEKALAQAKGKKRLLLGNGFSMAWNKDIFSYNALLDEADFSSVSPYARKVFDLFGTQNFEEIIRKLYDTVKILTLYTGEDTKQSKILASDADKLKEILVKVIAGKHPDRPNRVGDGQYKACAKFLHNFETIYTLNYDLLLYWTLINDMGGDRLIKSINDGFVMPEEGQQEYVIWDGSHPNQQNVFYLHGGLHNFDAGTEFKKLTYCNTQIPLMDQIRKALQNDLYPHFVAEGSSHEKLECVNHSIFLNKGYKSLQGISGNLFVFGHAMAENDEHILRIIEDSKIENVFVSIYGDPASQKNQHIIARTTDMKNKRRGKHPLEVYFFDAESARVWG